MPKKDNIETFIDEKNMVKHLGKIIQLIKH